MKLVTNLIAPLTLMALHAGCETAPRQAAQRRAR